MKKYIKPEVISDEIKFEDVLNVSNPNDLKREYDDEIDGNFWKF